MENMKTYLYVCVSSFFSVSFLYSSNNSSGTECDRDYVTIGTTRSFLYTFSSEFFILFSALIFFPRSEKWKERSWWTHSHNECGRSRMCCNYLMQYSDMLSRHGMDHTILGRLTTCTEFLYKSVFFFIPPFDGSLNNAVHTCEVNVTRQLPAQPSENALQNESMLRREFLQWVTSVND